MSDFHEKRLRKIERAKEMAEKARKESDHAYNTAKKIGSCIPMGQPILVGHHSERRHRSDLAKIDNNMRKSIQADDKAEYYENRAKRLENDRTISSDDPEALDKLKDKLRGLEIFHETMKKTNAICRLSIAEDLKIKMLLELGFTETAAKEQLTPDYLKRVGFAPYQLANSNQRIKTVKERIKQLEAKRNQTTSTSEINGVKVVDNVEANRIQAFFDGKPADEVRQQLKRAGFRWTPSEGCWQSYRNRWNLDKLHTILKSL